MGRQWGLPPTDFIARLRPTTRLLGLMCASYHDPVFGVALSDPYLSYARPLFLPAIAASELASLVEPHDVGGVALLEPLLAGKSSELSAEQAGGTYTELMLAEQGSSPLQPLLEVLPLHTHWPIRLTISTSLA